MEYRRLDWTAVSKVRAGALLVFGLLALNFVTGTGAASALPSDGSDSAVGDFGSCLASQQTGDLLLLIDESSSLQASDPEAARVSAANFLLDRLTAFGSTAAVDLNVAIAGFSSEYNLQSSWTPLNAGSLPELQKSVDSFRNRNQGIDTDYWNALEGARGTLADRPRTSDGSNRCQAVAWFSDGKLDFSERDESKPYAPGASLNSGIGVNQVIAAATESICRPAGIADQLRSVGVKVFGIGLAAGTSVAQDFDLMRSITAGLAPDSATCGRVQAPSPGEFFLAENIDDLLFAFDTLSTPGQAPLSQESGVCSREVCEEGKHRFVLDRSISAVNVLGFTDAVGLVPTLVAPNSEKLPLPLTAIGEDGRGRLGGVEVEYRWESPNSISFAMSDADSVQWQGVWALAFVDPTGEALQARSKSNIHISGNLYPAWLGQKTTAVHSGEKTSAVELGVVGADRKPIDPATLLGKALLSVAIIDSAGQTHEVAEPLLKDRIGDSVELDLSEVPAGSSILRLTLNVTTADATRADGGVEPGTELTPQSVDIPLQIAPPIGYPSVPARIDFGTLEGAGSFDRTISVTGPGCVRFDPGTPVALTGVPDGIGTFTVVGANGDVRSDCAESDAGLPVSLSIENAVNGTVSGTLSLMVSPEGESDREITVPVQFSADVQKPVDSARFWVTLVLALLLGPGIPLVFLYGAKWMTAKIPAVGLKARQIPIEVREGSILRAGRPFELDERDLVESVRGMHKSARVLDADGVQLRTRIGWSPIGAGYVSASVPGMRGASSVLPATDRQGDGRLPLAVHNTWVVFHDPSGPAEAAVLLLLVGTDSDSARVDALIEDARRSVPAAVTHLRTQFGEGSGSDGESPGAASEQQYSRRGDPFGGPSGAQGGGTGGDTATRITDAPDPFAPPSGFDPFAPPDGRVR